MRFITLLFPLALLAPALADDDAPFPQATKLINDDQSSSLSSLASSYASSLADQSSYSSLVTLMATTTGLTDAEYTAFVDADSDPILLGDAYFTATATPAWYNDIDGDLKDYVNMVAKAEASLVDKVTGAAERLGARVAVTGAVVAFAVVGMVLL